MTAASYYTNISLLFPIQLVFLTSLTPVLSSILWDDFWLHLLICPHTAVTCVWNTRTRDSSHFLHFLQELLSKTEETLLTTQLCDLRDSCLPALLDTQYCLVIFWLFYVVSDLCYFLSHILLKCLHVNLHVNNIILKRKSHLPPNKKYIYILYSEPWRVYHKYHINI